eukprot:GHVS01042425.1.p1 GENE.GHVS01042425.1~~GHVS01042425.1.p1  ORF type:complete len:198 (+),score=49.94 GHVS01042425.1:202-795(+)
MYIYTHQGIQTMYIYTKLYIPMYTPFQHFLRSSSAMLLSTSSCHRRSSSSLLLLLSSSPPLFSSSSSLLLLLLFLFCFSAPHGYPPQSTQQSSQCAERTNSVQEIPFTQKFHLAFLAQFLFRLLVKQEAVCGRHHAEGPNYGESHTQSAAGEWQSFWLSVHQIRRGGAQAGGGSKPANEQGRRLEENLVVLESLRRT